MRILGIDPGYGRMGYGVIEKRSGEWAYVAHGCIETSAKDEHHRRLLAIHHELEKIIKKYKPDRGAVEELFFSKNVKTAMQVGEARGVILLTLLQVGLAIDEFTPSEVKQAITGYGKAEKSQIQRMIALQLHLPKKPIQDDAADALAVALTSGTSRRFRVLTGRQV